MRTVALSEHTATRLAYRQYLGLLAEDDRGFRQAFRTAFFRAMREQLTPRQYEVLWHIQRFLSLCVGFVCGILSCTDECCAGAVQTAEWSKRIDTKVCP